MFDSIFFFLMICIAILWMMIIFWGFVSFLRFFSFMLLNPWRSWNLSSARLIKHLFQHMGVKNIHGGDESILHAEGQTLEGTGWTAKYDKSNADHAYILRVSFDLSTSLPSHFELHANKKEIYTQHTDDAKQFHKIFIATCAQDVYHGLFHKKHRDTLMDLMHTKERVGWYDVQIKAGVFTASLYLLHTDTGLRASSLQHLIERTTVLIDKLGMEAKEDTPILLLRRYLHDDDEDWALAALKSLLQDHRRSPQAIKACAHTIHNLKEYAPSINIDKRKDHATKPQRSHTINPKKLCLSHKSHIIRSIKICLDMANDMITEEERDLAIRCMIKILSYKEAKPYCIEHLHKHGYDLIKDPTCSTDVRRKLLATLVTEDDIHIHPKELKKLIDTVFESNDIVQHNAFLYILNQEKYKLPEHILLKLLEQNPTLDVIIAVGLGFQTSLEKPLCSIAMHASPGPLFHIIDLFALKGSPAVVETLNTLEQHKERKVRDKAKRAKMHVQERFQHLPKGGITQLSWDEHNAPGALSMAQHVGELNIVDKDQEEVSFDFEQDCATRHTDADDQENTSHAVVHSLIDRT